MRGRLSGRGLGLALAILVMCGPGRAATQPYLISSLRPADVVQDGAQLRYPATLDEQAALQAIAAGGMWVPTPDGGRIYLQYVRHEVFPNGDWTWVGRAQSAQGEQSAVITFGKNAVFGVIPRYGDTPLHLTTAAGRTWVAARNPAWVQQGHSVSGENWHDDAKLVPAGLQRTLRTPALGAQAEGAAPGGGGAPSTASATASAATTVDVMIAYTDGMVTALGSDSAVRTRINYLISYANQAYVDSNVPLQVRLVKTVRVSYTDDNSNDTALQDISGFDDNGNPLTTPAALSQIAGLRDQYGADLVSLMRPFRHATQGSCGLAWLIGGDQTPISSGDMYAGYSVIGDGSNSGYYCEDKTLTHELGHNMGLAHDRANASKDSNGNPIPGAFAYSFGYKNTPSGSSGFGTIMAYEDATQDAVQKFSGPDLLCDGYPCGVADYADNARTLRQTVATIAMFEPTRVPMSPSARAYVRDDFDGDGRSDLIWRDAADTRFAYWIMNGAVREGSLAIPMAANLQLLAAGDFNGDGRLDLVWSDKSSLWLWSSNGTSFAVSFIHSYPPGWTVIGAGDVDGDGKTDLLWRDASGTRFAYWIMDGATLVRSAVQAVPSSWQFLAAGDFNGDSRIDIAWRAGGNLDFWMGGGSAFTNTVARAYPTGWSVVGSGDVNGDGKADLLWRSVDNTRFAYWVMNGPTLVRSWAASVGGAWRLASYGDFNGDGKLDLVWASTSSLVLWPGNGSTFGNAVIDAYPGNWQLLNP